MFFEPKTKPAMITAQDIEIVANIKAFIDSSEGEENLHRNYLWWDTLGRMVRNLQIAPQSYRPCSEEDKLKYFYTAKCNECGWWGSSRLLDGGGQIADTGDYGDGYCPVCESRDIEDSDEARRDKV